MGRKSGIPGVSFSWKRAVGLTAAKSKVSRDLGVPLTKAGRQRKLGRAMGCCAPAVGILVGMLAIAGGLVATTKALAHGGGLNAQGCHNNRKTGDYHCHRAAAAQAPRQAATLAPVRPKADARTNDRSGEVYYRNCDAARAAGAAPIYRGDPGYGSHLDRDNDGIGCE